MKHIRDTGQLSEAERLEQEDRRTTEQRIKRGEAADAAVDRQQRKEQAESVDRLDLEDYGDDDA